MSITWLYSYFPLLLPPLSYSFSLSLLISPPLLYAKLFLQTTNPTSETDLSDTNNKKKKTIVNALLPPVLYSK